MPMRVGSVVWERWRRDWYMGRVVEAVIETGDNELDDDTRGEDARRVRVHVHGEPETADKWYDLPTPNLVELVELCEPAREIGAFPQRHDCVELLVMDKSLYEQLLHHQQHHHDDDASTSTPRLVGRVLKVYPARDASLVEVLYPPAPQESERSGGSVRCVSVAHGYLRVINEASFLARAAALRRQLQPVDS